MFLVIEHTPTEHAKIVLSDLLKITNTIVRPNAQGIHSVFIPGTVGETGFCRSHHFAKSGNAGQAKWERGSDTVSEVCGGSRQATIKNLRRALVNLPSLLQFTL